VIKGFVVTDILVEVNLRSDCSKLFWLMEILLAGCLIFPVAALWIQSNEDEDDEDNFDFL
jgi:hypothetical protein